MAVRVADTIKQQNDLTSFPVAYADGIWIDKSKGQSDPNYKDLQAMYNDGELGGGGGGGDYLTIDVSNISDAGIAKIKEIAGGGGGSYGVKGYEYYNTEEIVVGRWTNGKPIYRKVFTGLSITWKKDAWVNIVSATSNNMEKIFNLMLFANDTVIIPEEWNIQPNGYVSADTGYVGGNRTITHAVVEYTKTTDQPNSFKEEKIELTSEHKTGYTLNFKDVYEKTITGTGSSSQDTPIDISDLNIETLVDISGVLSVGTAASGASIVPIPGFNSSSDRTWWYMPENKQHLYLRVNGSARINQPYTITLRYTKTTSEEFIIPVPLPEEEPVQFKFFSAPKRDNEQSEPEVEETHDTENNPIDLDENLYIKFDGDGPEPDFQINEDGNLMTSEDVNMYIDDETGDLMLETED